MNICLCGGSDGYPHEPTCPYPLYRATAAQEDAWLRARAEKCARDRAEIEKRADEDRAVVRAARS